MTDYYKDAQERADKALAEKLIADAEKIRPFVYAMANGEVVEVYNEQDERWDRKLSANFITVEQLRIKPRTILVNGFEVPEPLREMPSSGATTYHPSPSVKNLHFKEVWYGFECQGLRFDRGVCHTTKEAAIAHAKAMLGIDPNGGDDE